MLILACAAAVFFATLAFRPPSVSAQPPAKLWSIDLGRDRDFHERLSFEEVLLDPPSVDFLNDSQIICAFYSGAKVGTDEAHASSGYHVLEIDPRTGALGRKLEFSAFESNYRALPVADGGFVVFANDELRKFSNQFVPGSSYSTARVQAGEYFDRWLVDVAPGGHTMLLYSHQPEGTQGQWTWLRTADLAVIESAQASLAGMIQASDTAGIFDGTDDRELLSGGKATVLCTRCNVHFLTDDLLFLDKQQSYAVQTVDGKERAVGKLDIEALHFSRAAQATRFAYVTGHYVGSGSPLQTHFESITGKIMVLDWSTNRPVAEIDVNEPAGNPSAGLTQMALAFSPDGKYLAVLLHHTLSLYRLP
jgi:hypothetical protein